MKNIKIKSLRKIKLNAGDTLIVEVPELLTIDQSIELRDQILQFFPGNKALVLANGVKLKVVSKADEVNINAV